MSVAGFISRAAAETRLAQAQQIAHDGFTLGDERVIRHRMRAPSNERRAWYRCGCFAFRDLGKGQWEWRTGTDGDGFGRGTVTGADKGDAYANLTDAIERSIRSMVGAI